MTWYLGIERHFGYGKTFKNVTKLIGFQGNLQTNDYQIVQDHLLYQHTVCRKCLGLCYFILENRFILVFSRLSWCQTFCFSITIIQKLKKNPSNRSGSFFPNHSSIRFSYIYPSLLITGCPSPILFLGRI